MARSPTRVRTLIDGYNLLHVTDAHGQGSLAGTLEGARQALLEQVASRLSRKERENTTIVFDAGGAPPGLPAEALHEGIRVLFARDYPDADAMLEELIEADPAPKGLLVVSSDHRVQRAARRRGAGRAESGAWHTELLRRRLSTGDAEPKAQPDSASVGDAAYWVEVFTQDAPPTPGEPPAKADGVAPGGGANAPPREPTQPAESAANPFPPGYAEDLAAELEEPDRDRPERR